MKNVATLDHPWFATLVPRARVHTWADHVPCGSPFVSHAHEPVVQSHATVHAPKGSRTQYLNSGVRGAHEALPVKLTYPLVGVTTRFADGQFPPAPIAK